MSGPGPGGAPDLVRPLLGFRVWELLTGRLFGVVAHSAWEPGDNRAHCPPSRGSPPHRPPHPGCLCGFNAFHALRPRLDFVRFPHLVGAIAAWGEVDLYRDGFRAEFARVIALGCPEDHIRRSEGSKLLDVARTYGVPVVPVGRLEALGAEHAERVSSSLLPELPPGPRPVQPTAAPRRRRRRPRPKPTPKRPTGPTKPRPHTKRAKESNLPTSRTRPRIVVDCWSRARGRGVWIDRHVAFCCRDGRARIGPAPGLAALLGPEPEIDSVERGSKVSAGDPVATLTTRSGAKVILRAPMSGVLAGIATDFGSRLAVASETPGAWEWLIQLGAIRGAIDDSPVLWRRRGAEAYRDWVLSRGSDRAVLEDVGPLQARRHRRSRRREGPDAGSRAVAAVRDLPALISGVGGDAPERPGR